MPRSYFSLAVALVVLTLAAASQENPAARAVSLWQDPGDVRRYDFAVGPGGAELAPVPPFQFIEEEGAGSQPKVMVRDGNERIWSVKFGPEAPAQVFATKLAWALGYWVQPTYFVGRGRILNARGTETTRKMIHPDTGAFKAARFELRSHGGPKYLPGQHWAWGENPFVGTPQLAGLKILLVLTSNWDTKDAQTAVFNDEEEDRLLYVFTDWGATMGQWGNVFARTKWSCEAYAEQSQEFIKGLRGPEIVFGLQGNNEQTIRDVTVEDVRWLMKYLGQISDTQLRLGLRTSGASKKQTACFVAAIRNRIEQLQRVANSPEDSRTHSEPHSGASLLHATAPQPAARLGSAVITTPQEPLRRVPGRRK